MAGIGLDDSRFLVIVSRDHPSCYRRLRTALADDAMLTVMFDRRSRRQDLTASAADERRQRDIARRLDEVGWVLVRSAPTPGLPGAGVAGGQPGGAPGAEARRHRILVVEDDRVVLEMMGAILRYGGYAPTVTQDPREALALLGTETFDLILLDVVLPHIDGLQVLEKAKQRNPGAEVVMVSGFGTERIVRESLAKGASDFIAKPFEVVPFLSVVQQALSRPAV